MKQPIKIVLGIIAVIIGMGFVLPAIAQWEHEGAMTGMSVVLCVLGLVMTLTGIGAAIHGITRRNA